MMALIMERMLMLEDPVKKKSRTGLGNKETRDRRIGKMTRMSKTSSQILKSSKKTHMRNNLITMRTMKAKVTYLIITITPIK